MYYIIKYFFIIRENQDCVKRRRKKTVNIVILLSSLKMPSHIELDESRIANLVETGGLAKSTLLRRKIVSEQYEKFVANNFNTTFSESLSSTDLESHLMNFFDSFRLADGQFPSKATVENTRSHLKEVIKMRTDGAIDISNKSVFQKLNTLCNALDYFVAKDKQ